MPRTSLPTLLALLMLAPAAFAHPGHDHPPNLRTWKDADGLFEIEAAFVVAKDDRVQLWKHDGSLVWVPLEKLSRADREWVRKKRDEIGVINHATFPGEVPAPEAGDSLPAPLFAVAALVILVLSALALKHSRSASMTAVTLAVLSAAVGCPRDNEEVARRGDTKGTPPAIKAHFDPFGKKLELRWDDEYLYVGSDGLPDHAMMVGITSWQQQVPIPQPYTGGNAWRIPLSPVLAKKPISARKALFRGAIALAVNGVPIFNALNNRGEDAYLAGELDEFGGHCGRGDDYHYHVAPVHLEKVVGKGKPIAYALDGFPLFGFTDADGKEPKDLDEFNGRTEKGGYRYYSSKKYPYINGGMRGVVTVRGDQVEPQPRDSPLRPAGRPLRGAKITGFERDAEKKTSTLTYTLKGDRHTIEYAENRDGSFTFAFTDADVKKTTEKYQRRGKKKGKKED